MREGARSEWRGPMLGCLGAVVFASFGVGMSACTPGSTCMPTGTRVALVVEVEGLPPGTCGNVTLASRNLASDTSPAPPMTRCLGNGTTEIDLYDGTWSVRLARVVVPGRFVRTVYEGRVIREEADLEADGICVQFGAPSLRLRWSRVPTSGHVWSAVMASGFDFVGLDDETLQSTAESVEPDVAVSARSRDFTFDSEGNVWALGRTTTDPDLVMYAAEALGSPRPEPMRTLRFAGADCVPNRGTLLFDRRGALWVSIPCRNEVWRIPPEALSDSGTFAVDVVLRAPNPRALAWDREWNLWVTVADVPGSPGVSLVRFDGRTLRTGAEPNARLRLVVPSPPPGVPAALSASHIVFDAEGDAYVLDATAGAVGHVPRPQLEASGAEIELAPDTVVFASVLSLPERPFLDEEGGLWVSGSRGTIARFAPAQLRVSSTPGAPTRPETVFRISGLDYLGPLSGYPAPTGLPFAYALANEESTVGR